MAGFEGIKTSTAGLGGVLGTALTTVTAGVATVDIGGTPFTCQVGRGLALAISDSVLVTKVGSIFIVTSILGVAAAVVPPTPEPPPPPNPVTKTGTLVCAPVETRSRRDGKWRTDTDDTLQGAYGGYGNSTGCAFYGTKPRSLDGATVTSAYVRIRRDRAGAFAASATTMYLITQATRPAGAVTTGASTAGPNIAVDKETRWTCPTAWAQAMVDGTAGGLAIFDSTGSPYVRLAGRGAWAPAWQLVINWSRTA